MNIWDLQDVEAKAKKDALADTSAELKKRAENFDAARSDARAIAKQVKAKSDDLKAREAEHEDLSVSHRNNIVAPFMLCFGVADARIRTCILVSANWSSQAVMIGPARLVCAVTLELVKVLQMLVIEIDFAFEFQ